MVATVYAGLETTYTGGTTETLVRGALIPIRQLETHIDNFSPPIFRCCSVSV